MVNTKENLENKLRKLMTTGAVIAATFAPTFGYPSIDTQSHTEKGVSYVEQAQKPRLHTEDKLKLYNLASKELTEALKVNPNDCEALTALGTLDVVTEYNKNAVNVLEKAANLGCGEKALSMLGNAYIGLNKFKEAENCAKKMLKLNKKSAEAQRVLGFAYLQKGDYKNAIISGKEAIKLKPKFYEAMTILAAAYAGANDFKNAEKFYLKTLEINPDYPNAHYLLGLLYKSNGDKEKAKKEFEKVIELEPDADKSSLELNSH